MIILGFDALDFKMVKKFNCKNMMQLECGKTDITGFALERTVVLWASFLTGKNMENSIPVKGQWEFALPKNQTFFKFFDIIETIDVPAFSFRLGRHRKEHKLLAEFFENENKIEEFDKVVWGTHKDNKKDFIKVVKRACSNGELYRSTMVMGYFNLADAIGHLSFGDEKKMMKVYDELEKLTGLVKKITDKREEIILVVSDHGMKSVGRFGDHTKNGFYSFNKKLGVGTPKITDFFRIIKSFAEGS